MHSSVNGTISSKHVINTTVGDLIAAIVDATEESQLSASELNEWVKAVLVDVVSKRCE